MGEFAQAVAAAPDLAGPLIDERKLQRFELCFS